MSAKQLLGYVSNKCTETEAVDILERAGIRFKMGVGSAGYEGGVLRNLDDQVIPGNIGQVTGYVIGAGGRHPTKATDVAPVAGAVAPVGAPAGIVAEAPSSKAQTPLSGAKIGP